MSVTALNPPSRRTVSERQWVGLGAACLGMMMTFVNITATTSALEPLRRGLHTSSTQFVWIASIYTMFVASLVMTGGTLGDRVGRKRVFAVGALVLGAGSLTVALAQAPVPAIIGEAVMGVGGAMVLPNSLAIVTHAFTDPHQRTKAVGAWTAVSGVGLATGPIAAGVLLDLFSWHAIFLMNVAVSLAVLTLTPSFVQESKHPTRRLDIPGVTLITLTIAALSYGVITGGDESFGQSKVIVAFVLTAVFLALFLAVERRRIAPMLQLRLFRHASFSAANAIGFAAQFGFGALALLEVLWFERVQQDSVLMTGVKTLPLMIPYVLVSARAANVARSRGFKRTIGVGLALITLAWLVPLFQVGTTSYVAIGVAFVAFGAGFGLVLPPATAAAVISLPHSEGGLASATVNMFRQIGAALGASITGTLLTSGLASRLPAALAAQGVRRGATGSAHAVAAATTDAFAGALHVAGVVPMAISAVAVMLTIAFIANRPAPKATNHSAQAPATSLPSAVPEPGVAAAAVRSS